MRHLSETHPHRFVARYPFAFPGGYAHILVMKDGGLLCSSCVRENYRNVADSTRRGIRDGWDAAGVILADHLEGPAYCDHCGANLSPYSEN